MNSIALTYPVARKIPRLSRAAGFWAVALSFLMLGAFATAPSALYGLYAQQEGLSGLTLTIVYAVYAAGIVVSLVLAGHLSDVYGRRALLIPGLAVAAVAAAVFVVWQSLPGLIVARVLTGVALGLSVATATAYIADLDAGPDGAPTRRSGIVATAANVGGLAVGPLIAGVLAQYTADGLTLPYVLLLVALVGSVALVAWAPEGRQPVHPRPAYRPQKLRVPADARAQFIAATTGAFLVFAVFGLFAGLAGRLLAGPLHHPSAALTGLAIFVNFATGALVQTTTTHWPARRLIAAGLVPTLVGLIVLVASAWTLQPGALLHRRGGGWRRCRRDLPGQPGPRRLHLRTRRTGRRTGDILHGWLHRGVAARHRPRHRAAVREPASRAAHLRRHRRGGDTRSRAGPHRCEHAADGE